jgi:nucleoside diphosphate kinase
MRAIDLTAVTEKAAAYEADRWYREGRETFAVHLRQADLLRLATITLKAEAVSSRQLEVAVHFVQSHGFEIVAARLVRFDANNVHQLWMYHWNVATPDRRALAQDLLSIGVALLLVVVDRSHSQSVPASVKLSALKGPAYPDRRQPSHLRSLLGAQGRMLTFVHTADEPADVLRELGLLFSGSHRSDLVRDIAQGPGDPNLIADLIASLYDRYPERSMDPNRGYATLKRGLELSAERAGSSESRAARAALKVLDVDRQVPGQLLWRQLRDHSLAALPGIDLWDPILYATERVQHDQPGSEPNLRDGTGEDWEVLARSEAP